MIFGEIESFFSFTERIKSWLGKDKRPPVSVATRFVQVFENHGVRRNQIPGFFGHELLKSEKKQSILVSAFSRGLQ